MADSKKKSLVQPADLDKKTVTLLAKKATNLVITNDSENLKAAELLGKVRKQSKELGAREKRILDPMKQSMAEVKVLFADPKAKLKGAEETIKAAVLAYHDKQETEAQKQAERIERRMEKGTMKVETGMAKLGTLDQPDSVLFTANGSTQVKKSAAKIRIIDVGALPAEYLQRERVLEALRLEVAADVRNGIPCPAGAEVYHDKLVAAVVA